MFKFIFFSNDKYIIYRKKNNENYNSLTNMQKGHKRYSRKIFLQKQREDKNKKIKINNTNTTRIDPKDTTNFTNLQQKATLA